MLLFKMRPLAPYFNVDWQHGQEVRQQQKRAFISLGKTTLGRACKLNIEIRGSGGTNRYPNMTRAFISHTPVHGFAVTHFMLTKLWFPFFLMGKSLISKSRHLTLAGRYGRDQKTEAQANVIRIRLDSRECRRRPQERRGPSRASRTLSRRSPRLLDRQRRSRVSQELRECSREG